MTVGSEEMIEERSLSVQLPGAVRIVLSIIGGICSIGIVEGLAAMFMLLNFGLAGSQSSSAVYLTTATAGMMVVAGSLAAMAALTSAIARDAWSLRQRWYLPMVLLALAIYGALLLLGMVADSSKLYGELLAEKRFSLSTYLTLTVVAALIGVWHYRRLRR